MKRSRDPFSRAGLLIAPLAVVPAAVFHLVLWHWDMATAVGALYAAPVILPLSYSLTLFVGIPYLFGMHRLGLLNATFIALGSLVVGLVVGFLVGVALFPLWDWYARFFYLTLGGICDLAVGLVYWLIHRLTNRA